MEKTTIGAGGILTAAMWALEHWSSAQKAAQESAQAAAVKMAQDLANQTVLEGLMALLRDCQS